jgi:GT2 family glycosyltransferase
MDKIKKKVNPVVSIVIINYKTPQLVSNCLESVYSFCKLVPFEVIIINNSDSQLDFEKLKESTKRFSPIIINPNKNLGTSKANNLGAAHSNGQYLFFLNSDTVLLSDAIYELLKPFLNDNSVGITGGNLFDINLKPVHSFVLNKFDLKYLKRQQSFLSFLFKKVRLSKEFNNTNKCLNINGYVSSAALMIKKNLFLDCGGFDEDIFMYGEDPLLCYKIKYQFGYNIIVTPFSKIIHLEGASDSSVSDFKAKCNAHGYWLYFLKAFSEKKAKKAISIIKKSYFERLLLSSLVFKKSYTKKYLTLYMAFKNEQKQHAKE